MRGEHRALCTAAALGTGSSPRAWGTHDQQHRHPAPARFIPTCVGNTTTRPPMPRSTTVHPHVRGEHRRAAVLRAGRARFIPTCVGNTDQQRLYPGDKFGSSPRAWGTRHRHMVWHRHPRFIPTCVGNTQFFIGAYAASTGSSPRAWGTRPGAGGGCEHRRFIPTCVGNTAPSAATPSGAPVHPHVRGEHSASSATLVSSIGSSPRAWGTRARCPGRAAPCRFIPTCVGNTVVVVDAVQARAVHPHVRGEHTSTVPVVVLPTGSSPRAWGTR